ncbi:hypothetical protein CLV80_1014 [Yoonia maritima]|uniref:Oxidoreductase molybdopterin-binding domain-containing protein n=1 Tax=Yoonia maritima TaxID=1435347 RepID=A0A2T0W3W3_9RHOB|nr:oxidoreductase [Yoonia maritima]PRY80154.1 hypothetical protein CLV80_1014 [Yoonia maritima]
MSYVKRIFISALTAAVAATGSAKADELTVPENEVILTVSGDIGVMNIDHTAQFDLAMLMDIDAAIIETATIWTNGLQTFQGVPLDVLLECLEVSTGTLLATAINDYTVEIPVSDVVEGGPMIAYMLNDDFMSIRDKGPLWIVYPYDDSADYRSEVIYSRSIWQLDRIEIVQ